MKCLKVFGQISQQLRKKLVLGDFCAFYKLSCPVLRFRRPILPRA